MGATGYGRLDEWDGGIEVTWSACERCGAVEPRFERSRVVRVLRSKCCGSGGLRFGAAGCASELSDFEEAMSRD